jgi:hypothetical protein
MAHGHAGPGLHGSPKATWLASSATHTVCALCAHSGSIGRRGYAGKRDSEDDNSGGEENGLTGAQVE